MKVNLFSSHKKINYIPILPPLIVVTIIMLVYFLKGIYPFGSMIIQYGDMDQHYIPFSYHIYDVFHNGKSLFWDPYLGTGSNIFGIEALSGMFSPISWLVVFTSRENIPHFASFILLIRMVLLSVTSYVFMKKTFPGTRAFWHVMLSVMYAFSGYVLIFYTNMAWIDCAILFPLIMLAYKALLDKNKTIPFILALSANLIVSYYISFMVVLFLLFSSGILIHFHIEKERRRKVILSLGIGTVTALLLTSFVTVPAFLQSISSIRFDGFSYTEAIGTDASTSVTLNKMVFFFFAAITLAVFIKILMNYRDNRKAVNIFVLLIALTTIPVVVEGTNKLWYGGSYVCYPLRFGFIPLFVLLSGCAWYFSSGFRKKQSRLLSVTEDRKALDEENIATKLVIPPIKRIDTTNGNAGGRALFSKGSRLKLICIIDGVIALGAFAYAVYLGAGFGGYINMTLYGYWGITEELSLLFMLVAILFGIVFWILMRMKDRKLKFILMAVVLFTEIVTHSLWYIGVPPRTGSHIDDWSIVANELHENLAIDNSTISRYKDVDSILNANYPLVLGAQAVSSYLHVIEARQQNAFRLLGYSTNYTRLLDTGGTLFSDMVFNIDTYLTSEAQDLSVFERVGESDDFYIYKNKYILPDGIIFPSPDNSSWLTETLDFPSASSPFDSQNILYRTLFDSTRDILEPVEWTPVLSNVNMTETEETLHFSLIDITRYGSIQYEVSVIGENYVYLGAASFSGDILIRINGNPVQASTYGNIDNEWFPASYNNGILNLGLYTNETIQIEIIIINDIDIQSFAITTLAVEKIKALSDGLDSQAGESDAITGNSFLISGNTIRMTTTVKQAGQSLFLPVNYDRSWICTINGEPATVGKIFGTFIKLDLAEGENVIELRFVPEGFQTGLLISGLTLLLFIGVFLFSRRKKASLSTREHHGGTDGLKKIAFFSVYIVYWLIYVAAILFFYVIPIFSYFSRNLAVLFK